MAASLTFPRTTFAKLSPQPFLLANLNPADPSTPSTRTNGRAPHQSRVPRISTSSLSHAHGSAVVRTGDTTVICGVRGEILPVTSIPQYRPKTAGEPATGRGELKDYDLLVPNIELATGCAPQLLPGGPPSTLAQTLSTRVYELVHSCGLVDVEELKIWYRPQDAEGDEKMQGQDEEVEGMESQPELKAYWTLYIDLLFVSLDGNPFDAAWAAVVAALRDTKLPVAKWDVDRDMAICSRNATMGLSIAGLPIACSAAVFLEKDQGLHLSAEGKHWVLLDPDRLEDGICQESVTVVVDRSSGETRVRSLEKQGGTVVGLELMKEIVAMAEQRWEEFKKAMPTK
ncbi:exosome complex exonuclease RRP43 [Coniochaeta ligniaria NRRL 30616]|uniref:Ribosomal RNA-processing protein 43 n=1 Tax=Coniochaeta ligniaria NRRL 30616 TaxID=1408157 RepID=A0A1J7IUR1_9PEZI|nr:exosome complex exonuclease RRP43 [Coniochaeta ligniaria NRRL 30616]